jgi:hypothetical protein
MLSVVVMHINLISLISCIKILKTTSAIRNASQSTSLEKYQPKKFTVIIPTRMLINTQMPNGYDLQRKYNTLLQTREFLL